LSIYLSSVIFWQTCFFLNVDDTSEKQKGRSFGQVDFTECYSFGGDGLLTLQRVLCQLAYFAQANVIEDRDVQFERIVIENPPNWAESEILIQEDLVEVHIDRMEKPPSKGFVDFANRCIHIHSIIPSATQEEVLFSCCPECFIIMPFAEELNDNEVIIMRNIKRYSDYTGYADTFKWKEFYTAGTVGDIIVIDACRYSHFTKNNLDRDLNKAWCGFDACGGSISTGHWGCGIFGGDKAWKFLQQLCAAAVCGVKLDYSTYGENNNLSSFQNIMYEIVRRNMTVSDIYKLLLNFPRSTAFNFNQLSFRPPDFTGYFLTQLKTVEHPIIEKPEEPEFGGDSENV